MMLHQLSQPGQLHVVVIEDIHWADEATLDLLRYLGRRLRDVPVLLIATYRDDGLAADDPLRVALGDLAALRHTRRISLEPLSLRAVREMAANSTLAADELHRLTNGNPFYVTETLQAQVTEVPPTARDAVLARAARLGPAPRELLDAAALTGSPAEVRLLKKVTGCTPQMLDEILASGLLSDEAGSVRFRHEIARRAIAEAITAHRAQSIHEQVLAALQSEGSTDDDCLAFHAEAADDGAAVLRYAPAAARRAAGLGAHREAAAQYERALRFAGSEDQPTRAALLQGLADEAALLDRWQEAAQVQERALALWREVGDPQREGYALTRLARLRWVLSQGPEAIAAVREAISALEPLGPGVELAWAYAVHAHLRMLAGYYDEVDALTDRAEDLASRFGALDIRSEALGARALSHAARGRPWFTSQRRALDLALAGGHHAQAGRAYGNLANVSVYTRGFARAERYLDEGIAYCEEHDMSAFGVFLRCERSRLLEYTGHWDEAMAEPHRLEFAGDAEAAAAAWTRLGCPYDAALALAGAASEASLRDALRLATDLGAEPLARMVSQRLGRPGAGRVQARRD